MKKISRRSFLTASGLLAVSAAMTACGSDPVAVSSASENGNSKGEHSPISICAPGRSIKNLIDVVHKYYPEIVFDVDPYSGPNGTIYMQDQLDSGNQADIYSISYDISSRYDLSDRLLDLAGYPFTENYISSRLREVTQDGKIYLLPSYYLCIGITYNKKILADHGWTKPNSLQELEELAPKVKAAGYRLALNELNLPGYGMQYMFNILDTAYLSTLDGRKWQKDFLNGDATLQGSPEMMEAMQLLQRWRDIGMLNGEVQNMEEGLVVDEMVKGNTLFLLGTTNSINEHGGNVEDYGLMPYLSEDGSQNVYILNITRYMGLSKKLEEPGNEQKLEDALHVMEILSTREGIEALNSNFVTTNLSPLKDAPNIEGNFYNDIQDEINAGYTAPFIYAGWENAIVTYGNEMISFICGNTQLSDVAACIDDNQHLITDTAPAFTTAEEVISTEACAKIVGIAFVQATGADLALISLGGWDPDTGATNGEGVNGRLFPLPVTEQEVCMITPTGWNGTIQTLTLSGKRVKELARTGYDRKERGFCYPYLLVRKDGTELADDTLYTVAICGSTESLREEGNVQDSGVHGMTAVEDYLSKFDTLTEAAIDWE